MDPQPENNQSSITPSPEVVDVKPKPRFGLAILLGLLGFLLLASLAAAGYFYYQNQNLKKLAVISTSTPTPQPSSTRQPSEALAEETTDTWQTYTNEAYHYSIKYPQNTTIEELSTSSNHQTIINKYLPDSLNINITNKHTPSEALYFLDTESDYPETIGNITWNHYSLPQGYGDGPGDSRPPVYGYQIENNGILYTIYLNSQPLTPTQQQILSTFRFTE